ncbi:MAG: acyl esterase [Pseudomonadales bacterium]|nr:acyl esterase [Pseudomonadales bacterium]
MHPRKIGERNPTPIRFSICTLVTDSNEYQGMIDSAKLAGFVGDDVEYLYSDNSKGNTFDGFSGFNQFHLEAKGQYLIYCHQDILFEFDDRSILESRIAALDVLDSNWAIAGNAGKKHSGEKSVRISDPLTVNLSHGVFPSLVQTMDENFMVFDRQKPLSCTRTLSGFHLYGTDLCLNAEYLGYSCYVIDFHLRHKSKGNPDEGYFSIQSEFMALLKSRKKSLVIHAMCSRFYVSSSGFKMWLVNRKWLLNLHKSISKKRQ